MSGKTIRRCHHDLTADRDLSNNNHVCAGAGAISHDEDLCEHCKARCPKRSDSSRSSRGSCSAHAHDSGRGSAGSWAGCRCCASCRCGGPKSPGLVIPTTRWTTPFMSRDSNLISSMCTCYLWFASELAPELVHNKMPPDDRVLVSSSRIDGHDRRNTIQ